MPLSRRRSDVSQLEPIFESASNLDLDWCTMPDPGNRDLAVLFAEKRHYADLCANADRLELGTPPKLSPISDRQRPGTAELDIPESRLGPVPRRRASRPKLEPLEARHYAGSTLSETPDWADIIDGAENAWRPTQAAADAAQVALSGAKLAAVGGDGWEIAMFCGGALHWLSSHATPVYHRIRRWWGGEKEWETVWEDYKKARRAIVKKNPDNDTRLRLMQDLRKEFKENKPHWADRFN